MWEKSAVACEESGRWPGSNCPVCLSDQEEYSLKPCIKKFTRCYWLGKFTYFGVLKVCGLIGTREDSLVIPYKAHFRLHIIWGQPTASQDSDLHGLPWNTVTLILILWTRKCSPMGSISIGMLRTFCTQLITSHTFFFFFLRMNRTKHSPCWGKYMS